LNGKPLIINF
jgi:hypothetical protein